MAAAIHTGNSQGGMGRSVLYQECRGGDVMFCGEKSGYHILYEEKEKRNTNNFFFSDLSLVVHDFWAYLDFFLLEVFLFCI